MSFEVGGKALCISTHPSFAIRKGQIYPVDGMQECPCGCGEMLLDVGIKKNHKRGICGNTFLPYEGKDNTWWFRASWFAPLSNVPVDTLLKELEKELDNTKQLV